jgi:hypothetical protein
MNLLMRKPSPLENRISRLDRERSRVENDIRTLSETLHEKETLADIPLSEAERTDDDLVPDSWRGRSKNPRLASYLGGSVTSARPLRQEEHIQRNKALLMVAFVLAVGFVVLQIVL